MKNLFESLEVDFPCLERFYGQDFGKHVKPKELEDPSRLVLLKHSGPNSRVTYPCGHKIDDYMVFRCPAALYEDCKPFVVSRDEGLTELRNFIIFDPHDTVRNQVKVRDRCPSCFFFPLLLKQPVCCKCRKPLLLGQQVHLSEYNHKACRKLGVMRVRISRKPWLVSCIRRSCAANITATDQEKEIENLLFVWNGKMLVPQGSPEDQALRIVIGAEKYAHACKEAFRDVPAPPRWRRTA